MSKITFVYPDYEHLGVEYLMAVCIAEGHDVEYVYYRNFYSDFNMRFKPNFDAIAKDIIQKGTEIAAFSCVTDNYQIQLKVAEALKKISPEMICMFGGIHVTAVPGRVIQNDAVDCIALGEADKSIIEFLRGITYKKNKIILPDYQISGIVFKKKSKLIGTFDIPEFPDLDTRPFPYKDPFYRGMPDAQAAYFIITTRGCPYNCSFCFNSSSYFSGKKRERLRRRSVENVISELVWAKEKFSPYSIWFADDCFTTDARWLASFCKEYKSKINLPFACLTHPVHIDREKAFILKNAGCYNVELGVQSLSEEVCRRINRKGDKHHVSRAITWLKEAGILVAVDHMFGLPGDTIEIAEESALFYNEHRPFWITVFWLSYFPKTQITETAREKGLLGQKDIERIEQGKSLYEGYIVTSSLIKNIEQYHSIAFLLNWMPLLPKAFVNLIVKTRFYRILGTKNYFFGVLLPRGIRSFHPRFYRRNHHLKALARLCNEAIQKKISFYQWKKKRI